MDRGFFKDLNTERLVLKSVSLEDAGFFFQLFSNPAVNKYLFDTEPCHSADEAVKWITWYNDEVFDHNRWIIFNKEAGLRLGTCGFHFWDNKNNRVEIGYDLLPEYWGKGYIHEAVSKALEFAFNEMQVHRVCATTYVENLRSQKVLERLGFIREGLLRDYYYFRGKYYDQLIYSLIKR